MESGGAGIAGVTDVNATGENGWIGSPALRSEDVRLLTGRGVFVADLRPPGTLEAAFLRSDRAHARIIRVDVERARALPGVALTLAGRDLEPDLGPLIPNNEPHPTRLFEHLQDVELHEARPRALAADRTYYVGQPVALVVAADRYVAEDGLDLVRVEYEDLPAVLRPEDAAAAGAPQLHEDVPGNVFFHFTFGKGDAGAALADAPHRLHLRCPHPRYAAVPMEARGVLAVPDPRTGGLTVWTSTQRPHNVRNQLSRVLGVPEALLHVVAPDVGGGFGPKGLVYAEEVLVVYAAMRLGRPVRWIEDRREHFLATAHGRDQIHEVDVGFDDDGRLLALQNRITADNGAYNPSGVVLSHNAAIHFMGPYRCDHYRAKAVVAATNKTPVAPYRGAGRPEAVTAIEVALDRVARSLGRDPADVRRRNLIPADAMPFSQGVSYRDGTPVCYDSGDYPALLELALQRVGYADLRRRQAEWWNQGRYIGVGMACYVEGTGAGPFEGASVRIDPSGRLVVACGISPQGQGHNTMLAQICAAAWQGRPEDVIVLTGDSDHLPFGTGTFASRSAVVGGSAVWRACESLKRKVRDVAAQLLEARSEDIEVASGRAWVRGAPARSLTLAEVASAAAPGWHRPTSGLDATEWFSPPTVTWAAGAHAASVEVDAETGEVRVLRYAVAHDCGRPINPMLVDGQILGGVAQGLGGALLEELIYDDGGQIQTATLLDYLLPTATEVPPIEIAHCNRPTPLNPLGVKGVGEGGAVAPPAVLLNAVSDALRPFGPVDPTLPLSPESVLAAIRAAQR